MSTHVLLRDWQRWEREIDWMAMHAINTPLAFIGQEWVINEVCMGECGLAAYGREF